MQPFTLKPAKQNSVAIVASIPHTGVFLPDEIKQNFASSETTKLPMTDWFLHHLYDFLPDLGVSVIAANYSRYAIDLNRSPLPLELYPGRFETRLVADKNFQGEEIFSHYPDESLINFFKHNIHQPYHLALQNLLNESLQQFSKVYLFDLHSIAKDATLVHAELEQDIYLGNRDGGSCSQAWLETVAEQFSQQQLTVQKNNPYKGGYITHHYGLQENIQALQIEMNQSLYLPVMDLSPEAETVCIQSAEFTACKQKLKTIFQSLIKNIHQE